MARGTRRTRDQSRGSAVRTSTALGGSIPQPPVCTTAPTLSGGTTVGSTLTLTPGVYSGGGALVRRQFLRDGVPIDGATGTTYVLTTADIGKQISVAEKMANAVNYLIARAKPTVPVTSAGGIGVPVNTAVPSISGTAQVGQTLSRVAGAWTNSPTSFAFQWSANGVAIPGATADSYAPVAGDVGKTITLAVTASNAGGSSAPATSAATSAVIAAATGGKTISLALGARGLVLGDSYSDKTFSAGLRNHFDWMRFFLNGRLREAVGGIVTGIAGTRLKVSAAANGQYADNSMFARAQQFIKYLKLDYIVVLGGINDETPYTSNFSQLLSDFTDLFNTLRSDNPNMAIFVCIPPNTAAMAGSSSRLANWDTYEARIKQLCDADPKADYINYRSIYNPTTMSIGDAVSHPNARGGRLLGAEAARVIGQYVAAGSVLPASTTIDADQIDTHFAMLGTGGSVAGTATGPVATGKTLTGAGSAIAASKEAAAVGEKQVITSTGTPAAVGATVLSEGITASGSAAGYFYELMSEFSVASAAGGAPTGLLQFGDAYSGGNGFAYTSTDVNAIELDAAVSGVICSSPLQVNAAITLQTATAVGLRHAATPNDFVAKVGRQYARRVDTVAYAKPFCISLDGKTSSNFKTQVVGTPANGTLMTARTGGWSGGGITGYAYQWDKNGVAISGATAATYTPSGFVTGDVLGVTIVATNSLGTNDVPVRVATAAFS